MQTFKKIVKCPFKFLKVFKIFKCFIPNPFEFATSIMNMDSKRLSTFAQTAINAYCLPIVCWPRYTNFCFPFMFALKKWKFSVSVFHLQQTNGCCHFPIVLFSVKIYTAVSKRKRKPRQFSLICYRLRIVQTEVCHLSAYWRRKKWKLFIRKQTK